MQVPMFSSTDFDRMDKVLDLLRIAPLSVLPDPKVAAICFSEEGAQLSSYNKVRFGEPHSEVQVVLRAYDSLIRKKANVRLHGRLEESRQLVRILRSMITQPRSIKNDKDLDPLRRLSTILGNPLKKSTLYVNLEPCSHFGKNPSCAYFIAAAGIGRVVFAMYDTDPDVQGKGEKILLEKGVQVSHGCRWIEALDLNKVFCELTFFMPKLFGGIHPTALPHRTSAYTMLGLYVPKAEVRSKDFGRTINVHTYGIPPLRHTVESLRQSGRPRVAPRTLGLLPFDEEGILFTTLFNPCAIVEMLHSKFKKIPAAIASAIPDMSFERGKDECVDLIREYLPRTHVCVGVRMTEIIDKLARISLRRRMSSEKNKQGRIAIVALATGVPDTWKGRVETRFAQLVGATTLHVSKLEDYLLLLAFLKKDVRVNVYLAGDMLPPRWRDVHIANFRKLMERNSSIRILCTEEDVVSALRQAGIPRVGYLEPYWEVI